MIESAENLGFAAGNNLLVSEAKGSWILLLNPDAFPEPDWLEKMIEGRDKYADASLFGCTQYADGLDGVLDGCGDVWHFLGVPYRGGYGKSISPPEDGLVFAPCGAVTLVRKGLFEAIGGFDEDYFCYVEDVDLGYRARLAGHLAVQLKAPVVHHLGYGSSGRRSEFATYHGVRNRLWTFLKNTPLFWLVLLFPVHMMVTAALWVSACRFGLGKTFGRALYYGFSAWPRLMAKRRIVQAQRQISHLEILQDWAWNPLRLLTRAPRVSEFKQ